MKSKSCCAPVLICVPGIEAMLCPAFPAPPASAIAARDSSGAMPSTPTSSSTSLSFTAAISSSSSYIFTMHGVGCHSPSCCSKRPSGRFKASSVDVSGFTFVGAPPSFFDKLSSLSPWCCFFEPRSSGSSPAPANAAATRSAASSFSSPISTSSSSLRRFAFAFAVSSLVFVGVRGGIPTPAPSRRRTHALSPGRGTQYNTLLSQILRSVGT
mmetsp:Transcript_14693/g.48630  ORF Transcript_14693/g.48630 Transcript_14693/m.48630 type:complete len:212 (+) Transcript_14693:1111-1746(+)